MYVLVHMAYFTSLWLSDFAVFYWSILVFYVYLLWYRGFLIVSRDVMYFVKLLKEYPMLIDDSFNTAWFGKIGDAYSQTMIVSHMMDNNKMVASIINDTGKFQIAYDVTFDDHFFENLYNDMKENEDLINFGAI